MTPDPFTANDGSLRVKLRLDSTAPLQALIADAVALLDRSAALCKIADGAVDGGLGGLADFIQVGPHVTATASADEAIVSLQLSERGLRLHAALRAGNVELDVIEGELRHLMTPVENPVSGGESGAASSPGASA